MSTRLLAALEAKVQEWMDAECEANDWPDAYVAPSLRSQMAKAAFLVFEANRDGQEYAESERE